MNRWLVPAVVVGALTAVTAAATLLGPQPVTAAPVSAAASRVSVVCPAFESATADLRVAAVSAGTGLRTAPLTAPCLLYTSADDAASGAPGAPRIPASSPPDESIFRATLDDGTASGR